MLITIIGGALGIFGTLLTWYVKTRKSAAQAAQDATVAAANATARTSAAVTDAARTNLQEQTDANLQSTADLARTVGATDGDLDGLRAGADALNAAVGRINSPKN